MRRVEGEASGAKKFYLRKIDSAPGLTVFQKKVLTAVMDIPRGEVRSYAWVAAKINSRACRAVGQALRRNPLAPHVPCHRVISSDGAIGGYSGGPRRKRRLLRAEGALQGLYTCD
ncbi:MAG: MGMT family protein [Candidatus Omnitrophica bacterium]|nr:MGMT family protein [Candidatus Omnitrophota bacterium]